jgi:hypothetical protein
LTVFSLKLLNPFQPQGATILPDAQRHALAGWICAFAWALRIHLQPGAGGGRGVRGCGVLGFYGMSSEFLGIRLSGLDGWFWG